MAHEAEIEILENFRRLISDDPDEEQARRAINQGKSAVRSIVAKAGAYRTFTISPPPAVGGLVMRNFDAFDNIYNPPYLMSMIGLIEEMIDDAIGRIRAGALDEIPTNEATPPRGTVQQGYVFVAMAMDSADPGLVDVLDSIKEVATSLSLTAERIDDQVSNDRITDRILESIRVAQFVVVDLTHAKPNVFYEAGYAQGLGKTPIYVARASTRLEFDIHDYPVIFFSSMRDLKLGLTQRLQQISGQRGGE